MATKIKNVVTLRRLTLYKKLQDFYNKTKFLTPNDTAQDAFKLHSAVNIDGVKFDGSKDITLPDKIIHVYSNEDGSIYYLDTDKTEVLSEFSKNKLYIDMTTNELKHYNGIRLVSITSSAGILKTGEGLSMDGDILNLDLKFTSQDVEDIFED